MTFVQWKPPGDEAGICCLSSSCCWHQAGCLGTCLFILCWEQLALQLAGIETIKRKMRMEAALAAGRFRGMCRVKYRDLSCGEQGRADFPALISSFMLWQHFCAAAPFSWCFFPQFHTSRLIFL